MMSVVIDKDPAGGFNDVLEASFYSPECSDSRHYLVPGNAKTVCDGYSSSGVLYIVAPTHRQGYPFATPVSSLYAEHIIPLIDGDVGRDNVGFSMDSRPAGGDGIASGPHGGNSIGQMPLSFQFPFPLQPLPVDKKPARL